MGTVLAYIDRFAFRIVQKDFGKIFKNIYTFKMSNDWVKQLIFIANIYWKSPYEGPHIKHQMGGVKCKNRMIVLIVNERFTMYTLLIPRCSISQLGPVVMALAL